MWGISVDICLWSVSGKLYFMVSLNGVGEPRHGPLCHIMLCFISLFIDYCYFYFILFYFIFNFIFIYFLFIFLLIFNTIFIFIYICIYILFSLYIGTRNIPNPTR